MNPWLAYLFGFVCGFGVALWIGMIVTRRVAEEDEG